jgi:hypothetical protein
MFDSTSTLDELLQAVELEMQLKEDAVSREDFLEANERKCEIIRLEQLIVEKRAMIAAATEAAAAAANAKNNHRLMQEEQLSLLLKMKQDAVQSEDFLKANELKLQIEALQSLLEAEPVVNEQPIFDNSVTTTTTTLPAITSIVTPDVSSSITSPNASLLKKPKPIPPPKSISKLDHSGSQSQLPPPPTVASVVTAATTAATVATPIITQPVAVVPTIPTPPPKAAIETPIAKPIAQVQTPANAPSPVPDVGVQRKSTAPLVPRLPPVPPPKPLLSKDRTLTSKSAVEDLSELISMRENIGLEVDKLQNLIAQAERQQRQPVSQHQQ